MKIPKNRLIFYLLLSGLLPIIAAITVTASRFQEISMVEEELALAQSRIISGLQRQFGNADLRRSHSSADHFYIDNALESLPLLSREKEALNALLEQEPSLPDRELIARLQQKNELHFQESSVERYGNIQETQETLAKSVEVDEEDLKEILNRIEGPHDGPQLLISDFHLSRKNGYCDNEVFVLDLKFLKREFL